MHLLPLSPERPPSSNKLTSRFANAILIKMKRLLGGTANSRIGLQKVQVSLEHLVAPEASAQRNGGMHRSQFDGVSTG